MGCRALKSEFGGSDTGLGFFARPGFLLQAYIRTRPQTLHPGRRALADSGFRESSYLCWCERERVRGNVRVRVREIESESESESERERESVVV